MPQTNLTFGLRQQVYLVEDHENPGAHNLPDDQTFSCLRLYSLVDVNYEDHQIDDLGACGSTAAIVDGF